jgi:hypothetical protein
MFISQSRRLLIVSRTRRDRDNIPFGLSNGRNEVMGTISAGPSGAAQPLNYGVASLVKD